MRNLIDYIFHFNPDVQVAVEEGIESYNETREREANVVWMCREDLELMKMNGRKRGVRWGLNSCSKVRGNVMVGRVE